MLRNPKLYLDLDEVIVDFVGGAAQLWGVTKSAVIRHWVSGKDDNNMLPALSIALGIPETITQTEFWGRIHAEGETFWAGLDSHPWADELLALVERLSGGDWMILSAPSQCPSSHYGKVKWLKTKFGAAFDRFCLTPHKHLFAREGAILIDDRESSCERFTAAGGQGILFPAHHNSLHSLKASPLPYLKSLLEPTDGIQDTQRERRLSDAGSGDHERFDPDLAAV